MAKDEFVPKTPKKAIPKGIQRDESGTPVRIPDIQSRAYGTEPLPLPTGPEGRDERIGRMAARQVQTQLNSTRRQQHAGETFYSHDAHGSARAIAAGYDYDSPEHRALRATGGMKPSHRRDFGNILPEDKIAAHEDFTKQVAAHRERVQANPEKYPGSIAANVSLGQHREAEMSKRQNAPGFGEKLHKAAGMLAATSPQTEWETNVHQAFEARDLDKTAPSTLKRLRTDDRDYSRPVKKNGTVVEGKYNRIPVTDEQGNKMALNQRPTRDILNAHDIWAGTKKPEDVVDMSENGRVKIGSFAYNIEHPHDNASSAYPAPEPPKNKAFSSHPVTNDFRQYDILTGKPNTASTNRGISSAGKTSRGVGGTRYDELTEAGHLATDYLNTHHAKESRVQARPLEGLQSQGVTWFTDREGTEKGLTGGKGSVKKGAHLHAGEGGKAAVRGEGNTRKPTGQPINKWGE